MSDSGQDSDVPAVTASVEAKAEMRRWIDRWKTVGPILEQERWARLLAASDDELRQQSRDLLALWQPDVAGDDGEAIVLQQRAFARLRARERV